MISELKGILEAVKAAGNLFKAGRITYNFPPETPIFSYSRHVEAADYALKSVRTWLSKWLNVK